MSMIMDMAIGSEDRTPLLPVEGHGKPRVMWAASTGGVDAYKLLKEALRQQADKGKEEKRGRKKEKEERKKEKEERKKEKEESKRKRKEERKKKEREWKEKERERERAGIGWRAQVMSCFGFGGAEQDKLDSYEQARLMVQERARKGYQAFRQQLLKLRRDDLVRKLAFKRIVRRKRLAEVNEEWSALPMKSEDDAKSKVTFREVCATDMWFYDDEAKPGQTHLKWMKVLEEIRENDMARALQKKWEENESQLREGEDMLTASQRQGSARGQSDDIKLVTSVADLGLGIYYMIWIPDANCTAA